MPHRRKRRTQTNIALEFYVLFFYFVFSYMHSLIYCQSLMLVVLATVSLHMYILYIHICK